MQKSSADEAIEDHEFASPFELCAGKATLLLNEMIAFFSMVYQLWSPRTHSPQARLCQRRSEGRKLFYPPQLGIPLVLYHTAHSDDLIVDTVFSLFRSFFPVIPARFHNGKEPETDRFFFLF